MECQPCVLCGENRFSSITSKYFSGGKIQILRCLGCNLVQVNPRRPNEFYQAYYKQDYRKISQVEEEKFLKNSSARARQRVDFLKKYVALSGKTIIDVGCSYGEFLRQVSPYAKRPFGIEPHQEFADYGKNKYNLDIFSGTLEDYLNRGGSERFDVVTAFTVLEHVYSPLDFLQKVKNLLKEEGVLILEFPEIFGLLGAMRNKLRLSDIFSVHHLQYFSKDGITQALKQNGYGGIKTIMIRNKYMCAAASLNTPQAKGRKSSSRPAALKINFLVLLWKLKTFFINCFKRRDA